MRGRMQVVYRIVADYYLTRATQAPPAHVPMVPQTHAELRKFRIDHGTTVYHDFNLPGSTGWKSILSILSSQLAREPSIMPLSTLRRHSQYASLRHATPVPDLAPKSGPSKRGERL